MGVGWSYRKAGDETWPAHTHMHPEAVEGLPEQGVFTESGLPFEAFAPVGASEKACWQRHGVHQREGGIVRGAAKQILPEVFLDLPEVGRLPGKGSAVHLGEGRKPFSVVAPKEEIDGLVGVDAEELADDLYGEDLGVGELWGRSAASDAPLLEAVVDEAQDRDDEGVKIHRKRPPSLRLVWAPPSVGRSPLLFNRSEKLAHGVSYAVFILNSLLIHWCLLFMFYELCEGSDSSVPQQRPTEEGTGEEFTLVP